MNQKSSVIQSFKSVPMVLTSDIAPLEELWISWLMKEVALKATYNAMLRGKV
jgi:hypothetical protein